MYSISNLTKLKSLDENASEAMQAFWSFDKAAFAPGAIDVLNKQLIAVAVALTTQCPYCIELHVQSARKAGATDAMLAETAVIAAAMRARWRDHTCNASFQRVALFGSLLVPS